ncbi:MAG: hypothetical protein E3J72_15610 [Planctomycetota bacterium]|nr:MAG: hypothetical protein E3J72_15610 [Planctomycetota bacterium]
MRNKLKPGAIIAILLLSTLMLIPSCTDSPFKRLVEGLITGDASIIMVIDPLNPPAEVAAVVDVQNEPLRLATSALKLIADNLFNKVGADLITGQPFLLLGHNFGMNPQVFIDRFFDNKTGTYQYEAPVLLCEHKGNFTVILALMPAAMVANDAADIQVYRAEDGKPSREMRVSVFRLGGVLNEGTNSITRFYASGGNDINDTLVFTGTHYPRFTPDDIVFGNSFNIDTFRITPDGLFILALDITQQAVALSPIVDLPKDLLSRAGETADIVFPVVVKIADIADAGTQALIDDANSYGLSIGVSDLVMSPDGTKVAMAVDCPIVNLPPPTELLNDAVVIIDISILSDVASLVQNNTLDDTTSSFSLSYVELPAGTNPTNLTFSPDGTHILVSNDGTNDVTVINVAATSIVGVVDMSTAGQGPREIAFRREGTAPSIVDHAIIALDQDTVAGTGGITRFNLSDFISTGTPPVLPFVQSTDPNPVGIITLISASTTSGVYAYVTNSGASSFDVFNLNLNTNIGTLAIGTTPIDIDLSKENPIAFFVCRGSNELWGADFSVFVNAPNPLLAYPMLTMLNQPVKVVIQLRQ